MSQFQIALSYVLSWEDPNGKFLPVPDVGGQAVAGINSAKWPIDFDKVMSVSAENRPQLVYDFYQKNFWNPLKIGAIQHQDISSRILDQAVNGGTHSPIRLLQRAVAACGKSLVEDGILGPVTIDTVNSLDQGDLLAAFRNQRLLFYKKIVDNNPEDAKYLKGWEKRALA
jgi:lysozyme family protein